jgi:hypothetical protein
MTTTLRTSHNGQPRKTLASQIDRLDGILDGLDAALAGAVQEAVGLAVKEAVQTVLTEVLTSRDLQEQLRQASSDAATEEQTRKRKTWSQRLWQATAQGVRRTMQTVQQSGRRVGLAVLAAGSMVAGSLYMARQRFVSAAAAVYRRGQRLLGGAVTALTRLLPSLACDTI